MQLPSPRTPPALPSCLLATSATHPSSAILPRKAPPQAALGIADAGVQKSTRCGVHSCRAAGRQGWPNCGPCCPCRSGRSALSATRWACRGGKSSSFFLCCPGESGERETLACRAPLPVSLSCLPLSCLATPRSASCLTPSRTLLPHGWTSSGPPSILSCWDARPNPSQHSSVSLYLGSWSGSLYLGSHLGSGGQGMATRLERNAMNAINVAFVSAGQVRKRQHRPPLSPAPPANESERKLKQTNAGLIELCCAL
jgi:hypothetical protein